MEKGKRKDKKKNDSSRGCPVNSLCNSYGPFVSTVSASFVDLFLVFIYRFEQRCGYEDPPATPGYRELQIKVAELEAKLRERRDGSQPTSMPSTPMRAVSGSPEKRQCSTTGSSAATMLRLTTGTVPLVRAGGMGWSGQCTWHRKRRGPGIPPLPRKRCGDGGIPATPGYRELQNKVAELEAKLRERHDGSQPLSMPSTPMTAQSLDRLRNDNVQL
ncbi:hypothetical protein V5799_025323 [Amblyomma americanum]|uniref:Uncharacterized protein n=1 Tax=Amblyomma americanum TaxID=6943 RepID=A0AAQ4E9W4_AMBAM